MMIAIRIMDSVCPIDVFLPAMRNIQNNLFGGFAPHRNLKRYISSLSITIKRVRHCDVVRRIS
jgi:hypothetical protein